MTLSGSDEQKRAGLNITSTTVTSVAGVDAVKASIKEMHRDFKASKSLHCGPLARHVKGKSNDKNSLPHVAGYYRDNFFTRMAEKDRLPADATR
jgi:hypothetical protein